MGFRPEKVSGCFRPASALQSALFFPLFPDTGSAGKRPSFVPHRLASDGPSALDPHVLPVAASPLQLVHHRCRARRYRNTEKNHGPASVPTSDAWAGTGKPAAVTDVPLAIPYALHRNLRRTRNRGERRVSPPFEPAGVREPTGSAHPLRCPFLFPGHEACRKASPCASADEPQSQPVGSLRVQRQWVEAELHDVGTRRVDVPEHVDEVTDIEDPLVVVCLALRVQSNVGVAVHVRRRAF